MVRQRSSSRPIVKNDIAAVKALLAEAGNAEKAKEGGNVQANVLVDVVDLNRRDHVGRTPLHMAIMCKAVEIAFELIDAGVRMTARLVDGRTALHLAAQQNLPSVVEKLLQKSAENAAKAKAEAEAVAAAQSLTKDDEGVNTDENEDSSEDDWESDDEGGKKAAVAEAAEIPPAGADIPDDNTELPDVFDINVFDWDFAFSPLAHAIVSGSKEVVQQLLGAGADARLASKTSEYDANVMHPLSLTILTLDTPKAEAIVEYLLRAGASSAQADEKLFSIFHSVVCSGKTHIVEKLLQADPHSKAALNVPVGTYGSPKLYPVVSAIAKGHHAIVAALIGHGAKVSFTAEDFERANNLMYVLASLLQVPIEIWLLNLVQGKVRAIQLHPTELDSPRTGLLAANPASG